MIDITLKSNIDKLVLNSYSSVYLLSSSLYSNTKEYVNYILKLICCENNVCNECDKCSKINENNYEDFLYISNTMIKVEDVENLLDMFKKNSLSNSKRVFIIEQIENMNLSSSNRLLKYLEEMKGKDYGILTTYNISKCLQTIVSRASIIKLPLLSIKERENELKLKTPNYEVLANLSLPLEEIYKLIADDKFNKLFDVSKKIYETLMIGNEKVLVIFKKNKKLFDNNICLLIDLLNIFYKINDKYKQLLIFETYKSRMVSNINMELLLYSLIIELEREK